MADPGGSGDGATAADSFAGSSDELYEYDLEFEVELEDLRDATQYKWTRSELRTLMCETQYPWENLELVEDWPHDLREKCICWDPSLAEMDFDKFYALFKYRTDMDEDEMREYHMHLLKHQDWPRGMKARGPYDRPYAFRLGKRSVRWYNACRPAELKQFVTDRGLPDPYPAGVTLKSLYASILMRDDKTSVFRFMDMPPEMRNAVYGYLLGLDTASPNPRKCNVSILRTCRQIYEEAVGVLYDNTFVVGFEAVRQEGGRLIRNAAVQSILMGPLCHHSKFLRVPDGIDDYPEFFRRIQRLEIQLSYKRETESIKIGDDALHLNHFVYTLASSLMEGHKLKHVKIVVNFPDWQEGWVIQYVLNPLRRLRNIPNVTFAGEVPKFVQKKLHADLTSNEPAFNTMRYWKHLKDQTLKQLELIRGMGLIGCDCEECAGVIPMGVEDLRFRLSALEELFEECCLNSVYEENTMAKLAMLKQSLQELDLDKARKNLEALVTQRQELSATEAITDSGRLDEALKLWNPEEIYDSEAVMDRALEEDSDDEPDEGGNETEVTSKADTRKLLGKTEIAAIMEEWEPDAASQLSRASTPSAYSPSMSGIHSD